MGGDFEAGRGVDTPEEQKKEALRSRFEAYVMDHSALRGVKDSLLGKIDRYIARDELSAAAIIEAIWTDIEGTQRPESAIRAAVEVFVTEYKRDYPKDFISALPAEPKAASVVPPPVEAKAPSAFPPKRTSEFPEESFEAALMACFPWLHDIDDRRRDALMRVARLPFMTHLQRQSNDPKDLFESFLEMAKKEAFVPFCADHELRLFARRLSAAASRESPEGVSARTDALKAGRLEVEKAAMGAAKSAEPPLPSRRKG